MKSNEINPKPLQEINIEKELAGVVAGSGTYEEIKNAVDAGLISLLVDNQGNVTGINYNSGKSGVEDALEGKKFEKRFMWHNVEAYIYKAVTGKELETPSYSAPKSSLPTEVEIQVEDLDGEVTPKRIKDYLRNTYDHYLSGSEETQFGYKYETGDETVKVTEINWGRKR